MQLIYVNFCFRIYIGASMLLSASIVDGIHPDIQTLEYENKKLREELKMKEELSNCGTNDDEVMNLKKKYETQIEKYRNETIQGIPVLHTNLR